MSKPELTKKQARVLELATQDPPMKQKDIAKKVKRSHPWVKLTIRELRKMGHNIIYPKGRR